MIEEGKYLAAETVGDVWINYPWEAMCVEKLSISSFLLQPTLPLFGCMLTLFQRH